MEHLDVLDAIDRRRAIRSYTEDQVPEATIHRLLDAAIHAPTAMHLEPWSFAIIQDRAVLARLSDRAKQVIGADSRLGFMRDPRFDVFYGAPTLIVICGKPLGPYVTADCWLAAENLMLAAVAYGLGTCCIGLAVPVLTDPAIKAELGIAPEITPIAPIIVGVPRGAPQPAARRPPEIVRWLR